MIFFLFSKGGWTWLLLTLTAVASQGVSPTGKQDGVAVLKHAIDTLRPGTYHLLNVKTKKYLTFLPGTLVEPSASNPDETTEWTIAKYKPKMYSINHDNGALKKCLSARWVTVEMSNPDFSNPD
jgi:hypothetical protein